MAWYEELFSKEDPARNDVYKESDATRNQMDCVVDTLSVETGCGQGKHLLDLARRGYDVVGLDLSGYELVGGHIDPVPVHAEINEMGFTGEYDGVINPYDSFGYLESPDEEQKALNDASLALRGGVFYLERDPATARRMT